jgi:hypothetical protein
MDITHRNGSLIVLIIINLQSLPACLEIKQVRKVLLRAALFRMSHDSSVVMTGYGWTPEGLCVLNDVSSC